VETVLFLIPGDVSAPGHFMSPSHSVEQPPVRHSNYFQESTQDSFIYPVILFRLLTYLLMKLHAESAVFVSNAANDVAVITWCIGPWWWCCWCTEAYSRQTQRVLLQRHWVHDTLRQTDNGQPCSGMSYITRCLSLFLWCPQFINRGHQHWQS